MNQLPCGQLPSENKGVVPQLSTIEAYKADDEIVKSFVQKTAAVSFLPPSLVCVAWQSLQEEAPEVDRIMISSTTSIAHASGAVQNPAVELF